MGWYYDTNYKTQCKTASIFKSSCMSTIQRQKERQDEKSGMLVLASETRQGQKEKKHSYLVALRLSERDFLKIVL